MPSRFEYDGERNGDFAEGESGQSELCRESKTGEAEDTAEVLARP